MNKPRVRFCALYRPIGALLLLLVILLLLLRSCNAPTPVAVPTVAAPTVAVPTMVAPTPAPIALPKLNVPAPADFAADGVKLSGTGQPGEMLELWDSAAKVGAVKVGADGAWSLVGKLAEGPHKLAARTVDAAGKILNEAPAVEVTVPKPISLPKINVPAPADFTAAGVKLSGTGQPVATIEVWDGATKVGTATVGADGTWGLTAKLAEGAHKLAVRTVDAAGKTLNEAPAVGVTVPKIVTLPKINVPVPADFTPDGVKLTGAGQPDEMVEVWDGTTKLGTVKVGADGAWTLVSKLAEGTHKLAVRTVDAAGKTLNEAPAVDVTVAADFTAAGVKLSGTGQPGATVEVWNGTTKVGTATVGADGTWSLVGKLAEGAHKLAVRTVDAAGKTLNEAPAVDVTVPKLAVPPAAIALPMLSVPAAADFTAAGVKLSGTGQPGATVEVWDGTTKVGTATVGAAGTWSLVGKLAEGAHKLAVRIVDAAGKTLNEAPAVDVTVPKAQPPAPTTDLAAVGQAYVVKQEDWLSKLAQTFYGDLNLYTLIIDGTNAKAVVDSTFVKITNPDRLEPGQKLWIPAKPAGR